MQKLLGLLFAITLLLFNCNSVNFPNKKAARAIEENPDTLQQLTGHIHLPEGFKIGIYSSEVPNARAMSLSPSGTLYVGSMQEGKVYALRDEDGDFKAEKVYVLAEGLQMPVGVAFHQGDLYVSAVSKIFKLPDIESRLQNPPAPVLVTDRYPNKTHHGWKYIAFGPDGKLYVPVGAPCNICEEEDPIFASITRIEADGSGFEIVQHGIRNTVGFTWHPLTKELWFTDNGRDWMGDDLPACELNHAPKDGLHFGYPYCHQGDLPDPRFGNKRSCDEFVPPVQKLGAHVAPLGLEFYTGTMFPDEYHHQIFIAEHGSWNRSKKSGYRVTLVRLDGNRSIGYEPFAYGWLDEETDSAWGRPVDIELLPDGSMLVSDDYAGAIYRIYYEKEGK